MSPHISGFSPSGYSLPPTPNFSSPPPPPSPLGMLRNSQILSTPAFISRLKAETGQKTSSLTEYFLQKPKQESLGMPVPSGRSWTSGWSSAPGRVRYVCWPRGKDQTLGHRGGEAGTELWTVPGNAGQEVWPPAG